MPFETLKQSHLKRNIIIGVLIVGVIAVLILSFTRAKYRTTQSIPLVTGTINYSPFDIRVSTKLLVGENEYIDLDGIPTSSNVMLMSSSCTNNAVISYNVSEQGYEVSNLTQKGTKCEMIYGMGSSTNFDYTGTIQEFVALQDGDYLLEVWGASGGGATNGESRAGGYGSYSKGIVSLKQNDILYIVVGGRGIDGTSTTVQTGGYNGGGSGLYHGGSGGGATHIATATGLLSTLSNNLDSILIVAGGGGGGAYTNEGNCSDGGHGGGMNGNDSTLNACYGTIGDPYNGYGTGGTQTEGGTQSANFSASLGSGGTGEFGIGATTTMNNSLYGAGGGGGGLYGGGSSTIAGAGGGSGYIGNTLLSDKAMYCYNCTTSSDSSTLTYSINNVSSDPVSNFAKEGNGYAKITLLGKQAYQPAFDMSVEVDGQNVIVTVTPNSGNLFNISKYYYSINEEYIESNNNTYTFDSLKEGEYEVKVYVVDEKNISSEVKYEEISTIKGITIQEIIANKTLATRTDFNTTVTGDTTGTIYYADTSEGRTYYFAGNPTDNWVKFGGFYWRIIRINEDGTIRMIYQGTGANVTGVATQLENESAFNENQLGSPYVGYMYTDGQVQGLSTNSTIKNVIDQWYQDNLLEFSDKIDRNAGFCGDRTMSSGSLYYYAAYNRLLSSNKQPSFECSEIDLYTVSGSTEGNKALTYPIGLITADEIAYAGGVTSITNNNYYLNTGEYYWTMTPYFVTSGTNEASVFMIGADGWGHNGKVNLLSGVRPVINLKANTNFALDGTGTSTNPYVVIGAE